MKLHLPTALRRALLKVLAASLFVTTGSASASIPAEVLGSDLGKTMFVGDSITNGAYSGLHSWRWEMHKILTDNGIKYEEVGVMSGDNGGGSTNMRYGESTFLNRHSSQNSARAYEIAERQRGGRFGGTGIQHWLGLTEPSGWSGSSVEGYRLEDVDKPVDTFFLLIGTNDLLSDDGVNVDKNLPTREQSLLGRSEQGGQVTWSGNGDMDTIVNAMLESNSQAQIVILTVPTWGTHVNINTTEKYKAVEQYNVHLKEWAAQQEHKDSIFLVDVNAGIVDVASAVPGRGVDSFFDSRDYLHPSAQGELLLAGNVAKGLGYAGRTAGQVRKAATAFNLQAQAIYNGATSKDNVTYVGGTGLTFAAGSSLTGNWTAAPEGGFTLEFQAGSIGNGATDGWDTNTGLTVSVGDGTHSGSLTLNEAYIQWGNTILYSMDMSSGLSDAIRIAYIRGNNSLGLATGFYVWLGDQLIGEALTVGTGSLSGVQIGNTTSDEITLSELAMDSTGSWAPDSNGFAGQSTPTIDPASASSYSGWPGVLDWPSQDKIVDAVQTLNGNGLSPSLFGNGETGCNVVLSGASPSIIKSWTGERELFVTVQEGSAPTGLVALDNLNGGKNSTADLHVRFSGVMTLPPIFSVFQNNKQASCWHTGDVYVEFSGELVVNGDKYSYNTGTNDTTYAPFQNPAVSSFFTENGTEMGAVNGKITYVFNSGTFNGRIVGGEAYGKPDESTRVTDGVEIYLNGGIFNGDIYAGGTIGYIGGAKITITGGLGTMTFADTVKRISAGGFGLNNKGGVKEGTAEVILENLTDGDGFVKWAGELSGGRIVEGSDVTRTLTLNNVVLTAALKATLAEFDKVKVDMGSKVTLTQLGGATELEIGSESTLTLATGSNGGTYAGMTTLNGGTIVLASGVNYTTQTAWIDDTQIAENTTGVYDVKSGANLTLNAGEDPNTQAKEVRGNVEVQLREGGVLTLGEGATGSPTDTVSLSKLVLSGGNSTLNVTGAWTLKGLEQTGAQASKLTIAQGSGSLDFSMGESSLSGPVTLHFGSGVSYSGALRIDAGGASANSHVLLEIQDILSSLTGTRAGGGLTFELTGLSDEDLTWAGFQLFSTGQTTALTDLQIAALEELLEGDFASGYKLGLRANGTVFLQHDTAANLKWKPDGQSSPTWAEGSGTTWDTTTESDNHFASGDNVIFEKLGTEENTTVSVSGTVHPKDITVGADGAAANYTLGVAATTDDVIDLAGNIILKANSTVTFNADVQLSGTRQKVTGTGRVTFGKLTGETLKLEADDDGSLVVGLSDMTNVTVGTAGLGDADAKGAIELGEGTTLRLEGFHNLSGGGSVWQGGYVYGAGTLDIALKGKFSCGGDDNAFVWHLVRNYFEDADDAWETNSLGRLRVSGSTNLLFVAGWSGTNTGSSAKGDRKGSVFGHIKVLEVAEGARVDLSNGSFYSANVGTWGDKLEHTYIIAGAGLSGATAGTADASALSIGSQFKDATARNYTLPGALELGQVASGAYAATLWVGHGNNIADTLTVDGAYDAHGGTLTKAGAGSLILTKVKTGTNAGAFTINGGTIEITGLADDAGQETKVATTVNLQDVDGDGTGTFKVSGSANYSVGKVVFGQGTETANTASLTSTAVLETAEGTTLTVDGGTALDFAGGAGMVKGGGTVVLTGGVTGVGAMGIDGATVVANAAWSGYTGGLYLSNSGTLQLGADIEVGYLGGTSEGYGGSITASDATDRTLTVTVGSGEAKGVNVGEHVTLKIGDGKTQNLINLAGGGTLELGAGATSIVSGTSAIGSIINAGTLNLYKGKEQVTLTVNGNVTTKGAGVIVMGTGGDTSNEASALTVNGNLELNGKSAVLGGGQSDSLYMQNGTVTVTGQISGTTKGEDGTLGRIRMGGGTLAVEGSGDATWDGYLMLCNTSTVKLGTDAKAGKLTVGGIDGSWNGNPGAKAQIQGNGELVLNVAAGTTANGNVSSGKGLMVVVSGKAHLTKAGEGTQVFSGLQTEDNAYVEVTGGMLQFATDSNDVADRTVIDVRDLRVTGPGVLDFARQTFTKVEGSNNITLSKGGTLQSSYSEGGNTDYSFGGLTLGEGGGSIGWSSSATGMRSFSFDSLSGTGDLDLSDAFGGTNDATKHSLNLGHIKGYSGTVSVDSLDENNVLSIDGEIEAGAAETTGSITVNSGAVTLNGADAVLKKSGAGGFSIRGLKVSSGQGLQMDYTGEELSIRDLTLEAGARLNYTAAAVGENPQLVELAFSDFVEMFESNEWGEGDSILLNTRGIDRGGDIEWLYLGIVAEDADGIEGWDPETLAKYFTDEIPWEGAELKWEEEDGRQKLYLHLLEKGEAVHYWDGAWDDGSHDNGPNNKQMENHAALWYSADESGRVDTDCAWSQMGNRDSSTDFTESILQLGGDAKWKSNGMNYVRLGKGSSSGTSRLTVLGGKLYGSGAVGDKLDTRVYISLWAPEVEHFHLLVGGSSFVGSNVTASGGLGFSGSTHIQVQGGTVDHIVGGNHVTNSAATFAGNTYISVYEGGSAHNEEGVPDTEHLSLNYGTNVRGGIVGGSTVTATSGNLSGTTKTYDFLGHSHIFIYTVLKSAGALPISDGDKNPENDVQLYNVVGGNAWIGLMPKATQSMVFSGSSNITIDLTHYQNFYHENAARGGLTFEKAIVGGNYSSTGASAESGGAQTRGTVFEYNSQGEASAHPYASQIEITGTTSKGESITFLGGINGASRRDSTGDGTTTFTATGSQGILLDLTGGVYRNYVAGGFWFGGSRYGAGTGKEASYTGTLTSDITVNLNGGEYWRVIGGSVNFDGNAKSSCTTTGNTVVTVEGAVKFGMAVQGQSDTQGTQPTQENLGLLLGGSLYSDTRGTFVQEGSTTLNVRQGTYDNTHIVAGDYMVYTDSETKTNSASITGGTNLTLGGGGGTVTVTSGIVVAGSYLSDTGIGGSVSVGPGTESEPETQAAEDVGEEEESVLATQVTVEAGVELNPMANHKVVLVGGNLLLDDGEKSQGGHTVTVNGDTRITVNGGTINGYIVGGSYTNNSANGQNTLETTGTVHIDIKGGVVNGDVFGGHFSENTSSPDELILHDVNITMSGGTVNGYIFGGSLRKATSSLGEGEHPTQGDLLIQLTGGTVQGGVYAAGSHYNTKTEGEAKLHVRTRSTRVEIGSEMMFKVGEQSQDIVISGGYLRSSDAATRANDYSTVGYDEVGKTWADECAVLSFTGDPSDYTNLKDAPLRFQDFDALEVNEGTLVLEGGQLLVMHKVADKDEFGNDSFAKMGKGSLVLGGGLLSFHGQDAQNGGVAEFTGKIILDGGTLTLGGGGEQSLVGGLQVNMFGRNPGNKSDAYLQVLDDGTSFRVDDLSEKNKMKLTLEYKVAQGEDVGQLKTGVYYIVDGLNTEERKLEELLKCFELDLNTWENALPEGYDWHLELRGENNEQLVLRVQNNDPNSWIWEGDEGGEWNPWSNKNWTYGDNVEEGDEEYKNDTFHFNSGADVCGDVKVASGIDISAGRIAVESGQYRFVQPENVGSDYKGLNVKVLQVGVKPEEGTELADVVLALPTGNIGVVELHDNGRFAIGHKDAIQKGTKLEFHDKGAGILKYAENENGYLPYSEDLSGQVSAENSAEGTVLHIQVGDGAMDGKVAPGAGRDAAQTEAEGVTWEGGKAAKQGIMFAVENGIVKSGYKNFTLRLTDDANAYTGTIEAQEGKLTIEAKNGKAVIGGGEGTDKKLEVAALATLELLATGNGAEVTVSRGVSGAGTLSIGSATVKNQGTYTLTAAVTDAFTGTLRLAGDGTNSTVAVQNTAALGNEKSTLALAGRAIVLSDAANTDSERKPAEVSVAAITVEGTNYVGGYDALPTAANVNELITLTAANGIIGTGVLANAQGGYKHTLEGDLSGFTGTIVAGAATKSGTAPVAAAEPGTEGTESTWTLSGTLTSPEVATSLAGTGTVKVAFEGKPETVFLTGVVGDSTDTLGNSVNLEHNMAGTVLVLAGEKNSTTGDLIFNGNEIWLGDETHASSWVGGVAKGTDKEATSRFVLRNGTLGKALEDKDGVTLVVDTAAASTVDVGKTEGAKFDEVVINDGGHLRGVGGDITVGSGEGQTRVELYFGAGSYGNGASGNAGDYLIESTGNLVVSEVQSLFQDGPEDDLKDEAVFAMDFSNEGLFELLKKHHEEGKKSYLHAISGGGIVFNPEAVEEQLNELLRTGTYSKLLYGLSFTLGVEGGDLILRGSSSDVYLVLSDESDPQGNKHTVNTAEDAAILAEKKATLLDKGTTLTVELGEGKAGDSVTVHNLVGLSGSALEASGEGTVFLDNTEVVPDPLDTDPWVSDKVGDAGGNHVGKLKGQDTYFDGMIRGKDVQTRFVKTGAGTLTVGDGTESGGVDIAGELRLEDGDFVVRGKNGVLGTLTFAYGEDAAHTKGFVVQGGKVTVGTLNDETGSGKVTLEQRGVFAFVGNNTTGAMPENLQFTGNGTLEVGGDEDGGKLALGGTSAIEGLNVQVDKDSTLSLRDGAALDGVETVTLSENATLDLSGSAHETRHTVGTLTDNSKGTGILKGGTNTDLTVKGGSFRGTLSGSGKLTIDENAAFSMAGVKTDASASTNAWGITVRKDGSLTLDTSEQHGSSGPTFGDVVFGDDSDITLRFDYNTDNGSTVRTHSLSIEKGAHLTLESVNVGPYSGTDMRVRIAYSDVEGEVAENVEVELKGVSFLHFEKNGNVVYEDGAYYVGVKEVEENGFEQALPGMDKNAQAGAKLFWSVSAPSKSEALANVIANPNSDLYLMLYGLTEMLDNNNKAGLERTLAAGAGASISVLGPALAEDMHRQLVSMRNRSTGLTEDLPTDGYDAFPYWHAWITGEGGYHKLDADGFAPGYTLNNWGGSVGADANITQRTSVGLALTAMYGDLKPDAADSASGNIDTVYLSGYLRHAIGAWSHTVALSVGMADVKLDRTVSYGSGSYHTNGDTDGLAFGLLYEVGYTKFVNKNRTFALQPIANVELRHAMIDGYTETGSDAGLRVDDIEQTILTFGAGVRVQGLVGGRAFNDSAMLEARALVKADVGDRSGTSKHAIIHDTTQAEVESAEVGAVGVEAGVGLSIPLGRNLGSIIIDGSVEFRSGWTSANASAGYRISF